MINTIIFDFDGTIIDTESTEYNSWEYIFSQYGLGISFDIWRNIIGKPRGTVNFYDYLEEQLGYNIDKDKIRKERLERNLEENRKLKPLPGIVEYINYAKANSMKTGIVSSSDRKWVYGHLERLNLLDKFDAIICEEDSEIHKPNPEPFLVCVNKFGVSVDNAIAIEDSPNGVKAATSAGIFCVAVPNKITAQLDLSLANLKLNALADMAPGALMKMAEEFYMGKQANCV